MQKYSGQEAYSILDRPLGSLEPGVGWGAGLLCTGKLP